MVFLVSDEPVKRVTEERTNTPLNSDEVNGWGPRIRTSTYGSRIRCPTIRRVPSDEFYCTSLFGHSQAAVFTHYSLTYNVTEGSTVHSARNVTEGTMPTDERMTIDERRKYLKLMLPRYIKGNILT